MGGAYCTAYNAYFTFNGIVSNTGRTRFLSSWRDIRSADNDAPTPDSNLLNLRKLEENKQVCKLCSHNFQDKN